MQTLEQFRWKEPEVISPMIQVKKFPPTWFLGKLWTVNSRFPVIGNSAIWGHWDNWNNIAVAALIFWPNKGKSEPMLLIPSFTDLIHVASYKKTIVVITVENELNRKTFHRSAS